MDGERERAQEFGFVAVGIRLTRENPRAAQRAAFGLEARARGLGLHAAFPGAQPDGGGDHLREDEEGRSSPATSKVTGLPRLASRVGRKIEAPRCQNCQGSDCRA